MLDTLTPDPDYEREFADSVARCRAAAEAGDAEAQYQMGLNYGLGDGVPEDPVEASRWYRKAAEQGMVRAEVTMAKRYRRGLGVTKDETQAIDWFRRAAGR